MSPLVAIVVTGALFGGFVWIQHRFGSPDDGPGCDARRDCEEARSGGCAGCARASAPSEESTDDLQS